MARRLTDKAVERLRVKAKTFAIWDSRCTGLGIRITRAGRRIWILQLKFPGGRVQSKRTLGVFPAMKVAAARAKAEEWRAATKAGIDPKDAEADKARAVEAARRAAALQNQTTFASVAQRYVNEHLATHRRRAAATREINNEL